MGVILPGEEEHAQDCMNELRSLAETAGAEVVGELIQHRAAPDKTYFMGKGKALEASHEAFSKAASLLILDNDLSPAQARNMEKITGLRVVERSQLIMDIFASGARTLQARRQVELAQLQFFLPRLKRLWSHLSRIRSGIGMRGPGETQLEVDRRIVRKKISELKRELKSFENRKNLEIDSRKDFFKVCLVGYTNSGKSSLLNRLTGASVLQEDRLFSTLDTRTRLWPLEGGLQVLLSDTVGFIRKLPPNLVASFHATLEEAARADLLLHVVDGSHPAAMRHVKAVEQVIQEIGGEKIPSLLVINKSDRVDDFMEISLMRSRYPAHVVTSAREGRGLDRLADAVREHLLSHFAEVMVDLPRVSGKLDAFLSRVGDVLTCRYTDGRHHVTARIPPFELGRLKELVTSEEGALKITWSES